MAALDLGTATSTAVASTTGALTTSLAFGGTTTAAASTTASFGIAFAFDGTITATASVATAPMVNVIYFDGQIDAVSAAERTVESGGSGIDTNTRLMMHMDSGTPTDSSQYGVTCVGAYPSATQTKFGANSYFYDGNGQNTTCGNLTELNIASEHTIDFWVYRDVADNGPLISNWDTTTTSYKAFRVLTGVDGSMVYEIYDTDNVSRQIVTASVIPLATWVHVACVFTAGALTLYVDGVSVGTIAAPNPMRVPTSFQTRIANSSTNGLSATGGNNRFRGFIDEMRVSDTARWTTNFTPPTVAYEAGTSEQVAGALISVDKPIAGQIDVESSSTSNIGLPIDFGGQIDTTSSINADLLADKEMAGQIDAVSSSASSDGLLVDRLLSGQIDATVSLDDGLVLLSSISGQINASAVIVGAVLGIESTQKSAISTIPLSSSSLGGDEVSGSIELDLSGTSAISVAPTSSSPLSGVEDQLSIELVLDGVSSISSAPMGASPLSGDEDDLEIVFDLYGATPAAISSIPLSSSPLGGEEDEGIALGVPVQLSGQSDSTSTISSNLGVLINIDTDIIEAYSYEENVSLDIGKEFQPTTVVVTSTVDVTPLLADKEIGGQIDVLSTVDAGFGIDIGVDGQIDAVSSVDVSLDVIKDLSLLTPINAVTTVSVTGELLVDKLLGGDIDVASTMSSPLDGIKVIYGNVDAVSTTTGDVTNFKFLEGTINATSTVEDTDFSYSIPLGGVCNANCTPTAELGIAQHLEAYSSPFAPDCEATVTATITNIKYVGATSTSSSNIVGALANIKELTGDCNAVSSGAIDSDLFFNKDLVGDTTATSSSTGNTEVSKLLSGTCLTTSSSSGVSVDVGNDIELIGHSSTVSVLTTTNGTITNDRPILGNVVGAVTAQGTMSSDDQLTGVINVVSSGSAEMINKSLEGSLSATSTVIVAAEMAIDKLFTSDVDVVSSGSAEMNDNLGVSLYAEEITAVSTVDLASMSRGYALDGTITGEGTITDAVLGTLVEFGSTVTVTSSVNTPDVNVYTTVAFDSTVTVTSAVVGADLDVQKTLEATVEATSTTTGTVLNTVELSGEITTTSTSHGFFFSDVDLTNWQTAGPVWRLKEDHRTLIIKPDRQF